MASTLQPLILDGGLVVRGTSNTIQVPSGTTAQRPTPTVNGHLRLNNDNLELESYTNSIWKAVNYKVRWFTETVSLAIPSGDSGLGYLFDTRSGALTATLPASPSVGTVIIIGDYAGSANNNNITIARNGSPINLSSSNFIISLNNEIVTLQYIDATVGWKTTSNYIDLSSVTNAISGILTVPMGAGTVVLTSTQAAFSILIFTGTLTANGSVTFPAGQQTTFGGYNNTSGAYTLTLKSANTGTVQVLAQGCTNDFWTDGTNIILRQTDYTSIALQGIPTTPTASPLTNSIQVASTAYADAADVIVTNAAIAYSIIFG